MGVETNSKSNIACIGQLNKSTRTISEAKCFRVNHLSYVARGFGFFLFDINADVLLLIRIKKLILFYIVEALLYVCIDSHPRVENVWVR